MPKQLVARKNKEPDPRQFHIPHDLDLWSFPDIFFYETGYFIYTLRQADRRAWRIGQRSNVNVKFLCGSKSKQVIVGTEE